MKKGFTIVEVSILFVIFLIVAFLVAPMSLDDTMQAKHTSRWKSVQQDFQNIFYSIDSQKDETSMPFKIVLESILENEVKSDINTYRINYMNGNFPKDPYRFKIFKQTYSNATIATNLFNEPKGEQLGVLMYDVNGEVGPNTWGKDVFGLNIYKDRFEPLGKDVAVNTQKQDCSRNGTGVFCSNYYLIGGSFD